MIYIFNTLYNWRLISPCNFPRNCEEYNRIEKVVPLHVKYPWDPGICKCLLLFDVLCPSISFMISLWHSQTHVPLCCRPVVKEKKKISTRGKEMMCADPLPNLVYGFFMALKNNNNYAFFFFTFFFKSLSFVQTPDSKQMATMFFLFLLLLLLFSWLL